MAPTKYTLVQHSAAPTHADFDRAVELCSIFGRQVSQVAEAGGLIFNSYQEAANAEEEANYPADASGLRPRVAGSFSTVRIDGLPVYLPATVSVEEKVAAGW